MIWMDAVFVGAGRPGGDTRKRVRRAHAVSGYDRTPYLADVHSLQARMGRVSDQSSPEPSTVEASVDSTVPLQAVTASLCARFASPGHSPRGKRTRHATQPVRRPQGRDVGVIRAWVF